MYTHKYTSIYFFTPQYQYQISRIGWALINTAELGILLTADATVRGSGMLSVQRLKQPQAASPSHQFKTYN